MVKITNGVNISVKKDRIYLYLEKYKPIVIFAEDEFRKGIEIRVCSKCKSFKSMVMYVGKKSYCEECADDHFKKRS